MKFTEFRLDKALIEGIEAFGFKKATPIQEKAIPAILAGKDIIGSAQTGTGKTAAFLLPLINNIIQNKKDDHIKALVIVPTRELAMQIDQQLEGLAYFTPVSSIAVYGGTDGTTFSSEKKALSEGADMVIGTPGRLIAHFNMGYVKVAELEYLVLDEADRMLDMGFYDDIVKILSFLPKKRQNLLFSATMPNEIKKLAKTVLNNPLEISIAISKPADKILQAAYLVHDSQKIQLVQHLLEGKKLKSILIFCSTKQSTKDVFRELRKKKMSVGEIHSDLDQKARQKVLMDFKNRDTRILVATDILSRGIDVEDIDLVINYDIPNDAEDYIHRIGRTARAESDGVAITFINEKEGYKLKNIEDLLGKSILKLGLPSEIGVGPELKPHRNPKKKPYYKKKK